jgi:hypothetical protein
VPKRDPSPGTRTGNRPSYRTSSCSGCLSLNSWPTMISAVSIYMPEARSLANSLTNDAESGPPASISMASSSVEGACVLSELRVLGLNQYILSPFPETLVPDEAHPKPGSDGASAVPSVTLLGGEGLNKDGPAWYAGTRAKVESRAEEAPSAQGIRVATTCSTRSSLVP